MGLDPNIALASCEIIAEKTKSNKNATKFTE